MLKSNRIIARTAIADLDLTSRVQLEAEVTDARSQAIDFQKFKRLDTGWTCFTAGRDWRRYVADFFGPLEGKTLLDVACGYSMTPVIFALAGARASRHRRGAEDDRDRTAVCGVQRGRRLDAGSCRPCRTDALRK